MPPHPPLRGGRRPVALPAPPRAPGPRPWPRPRSVSARARSPASAGAPPTRGRTRSVLAGRSSIPVRLSAFRCKSSARGTQRPVFAPAAWPAGSPRSSIVRLPPWRVSASAMPTLLHGLRACRSNRSAPSACAQHIAASACHLPPRPRKERLAARGRSAGALDSPPCCPCLLFHRRRRRPWPRAVTLRGTGLSMGTNSPD